jgi:hypothetical protein
MNRFLLMILVALFSNSTHATEDQMWKRLYDCTDDHISNVARVVPSLSEGANLIIRSLCSTQATDLANYLAKNRTDDIGHGDFVSRFRVYINLIERELILRIYRQKIRSPLM